jgi:hypothetical protein
MRPTSCGASTATHWPSRRATTRRTSRPGSSTSPSTATPGSARRALRHPPGARQRHHRGHPPRRIGQRAPPRPRRRSRHPARPPHLRHRRPLHRVRPRHLPHRPGGLPARHPEPAQGQACPRRPGASPRPASGRPTSPAPPRLALSAEDRPAVTDRRLVPFDLDGAVTTRDTMTALGRARLLARPWRLLVAVPAIAALTSADRWPLCAATLRGRTAGRRPQPDGRHLHHPQARGLPPGIPRSGRDPEAWRDLRRSLRVRAGGPPRQGVGVGRVRWCGLSGFSSECRRP